MNYPCRDCGAYAWINKNGVLLCRQDYYKSIGKTIPETISVAEYKEMRNEASEDPHVQQA